jgi:hypothetical protein
MSIPGIAVPGTVVPSGSLTGPGGATGLQGLQGNAGPNAVSADAGNLATLGSDNLISVPSSSIWSMRLRSFNAIGNPNFEVDQKQAGNTIGIGAAGSGIDRWLSTKVGLASMTGTVQQVNPSGTNITVPGTNFVITARVLRVTLTAQQTTVAAGDYYQINQLVEGPQWRELMGDYHSVQLLVRSTFAGLSFGLCLKDPGPATKTLTKLCTIPNVNTWTLIPLPNLPQWPSGNFVTTPGSNGYQCGIVLVAGSSLTSPANDTWQNGAFNGALGQSNFAACPTGTQFEIAFVQHEPGPACTTLIDKTFSQNLDECLRYYDKSYRYSNAPGSADTGNAVAWWTASGIGQLFGGVSFKKKMAKAPPTITVYSPVTGAANSVRDYTGNVDTAVASILGPSDSGFNGINLSTSAAAARNFQFQWTADTGW